MDEERRTSVNLEACIARAAERVIFVNTGFLDRTGDEIHTDFEAGPVVRKDDEKSTTWLQRVRRPQRRRRAARRVRRAGPDRQGHVGPARRRCARCSTPRAPSRRPGANTAWVPSPTAATLHALHYLETDVHAVQAELAERPLTDRRKLLVVPVLPDGGAGLTDEREAPRAGDERAVDPRLRRALGRAGHRLLDGAGPGGRRPDGGPGDAAHLQPGDRELAAPRSRRRGPGARDLRPDGGARRRAERPRARLPADEQGPRAQPVVPGGAGAGVRRTAGAQRLHRAGADPLAAEGQGRGHGNGGGTRTAVLDDGAPRARRAGRAVLELRPATYDHPDAALLVAAVQREYVAALRRRGRDARSTRPSSRRRTGTSRSATWRATPVACGGWRARGRRASASRSPARRRRGDQADVRLASHRGRGYARAVLAELERTAAAAGRRRAVLETGTRQPEAIALYTSAGLPARGAFRVLPRGSGLPVLRQAADAGSVPADHLIVISGVSRSAGRGNCVDQCGAIHTIGEGCVRLATTRREGT